MGTSANLIDASRETSTRHVGSVLVMEEGSLLGIFTERDILRALSSSSSADAARVSHVDRWMTAEPTTTQPDVTIGAALDVMLSSGFRHLPVVEGGAVAGVVSMRDLVCTMSKS